MTVSLRDHLAAVYVDNGGRLTPASVVNAARPKSSPLHAFFEWDDKVAGDKYRLHQASQLIRSVRMTVREGTDDEGPLRLRVWHSVDDGGGPTPAYKPLDEVAADPVMRQMVLQAAARDWQALRRRYQHLSEFLELVRGDLADVG